MAAAISATIVPTSRTPARKTPTGTESAMPASPEDRGLGIRLRSQAHARGVIRSAWGWLRVEGSLEARRRRGLHGPLRRRSWFGIGKPSIQGSGSSALGLLIAKQSDEQELGLPPRSLQQLTQEPWFLLTSG